MRSALIVVVPEAAAVESVRLQHSAAARAGVPAHVTVLVPFVPPGEIGEALVDELRELFAAVPAFDFALRRANRWEPGILWLAPEPDDPFRELTRLVTDRWPEYPPYGGEHPENIPHLTVTHDAPPADVDRAEEATRRTLPIRAHAENVGLWTEDETGRWSELERFPLAG